MKQKDEFLTQTLIFYTLYLSKPMRPLSYFAQILKKIFVFDYFIFSDILVFGAIRQTSRYNFRK